jgi:predicted nucleic acid-binding Zn ribbon protein
MLPPFRFKPALGPRRSSSRERALSQWRGVNLAPLEQARTLTAQSAAECMPHVLKELRIDKRRIEAEVVKVWGHLMDPQVAAHAQPTGLRKGTLFVTVDSSSWLSEIVRYRRKEILQRLQYSFGPEFIQKISFRVG